MSKTWEHRVPTPDSVSVMVSEDDPDIIVVWSDTENIEPEAATIRDAARQQAWRLVGVPHNPDAALTKYARAQRMGAPLTTEFDFQHDGVMYRGQGYAMGIVYAEVDVWTPVWMAWW